MENNTTGCPSGAATCSAERQKKQRFFGALKRCGLCHKRNPFKSVLKCKGCKMTYHRSCGERKHNEKQQQAEVRSVVDCGDREVIATNGQQEVVPAATLDNPANPMTMTTMEMKNIVDSSLGHPIFVDGFKLPRVCDVSTILEFGYKITRHRGTSIHDDGLQPADVKSVAAVYGHREVIVTVGQQKVVSAATYNFANPKTTMTTEKINATFRQECQMIFEEFKPARVCNISMITAFGCKMTCHRGISIHDDELQPEVVKSVVVYGDREVITVDGQHKVVPTAVSDNPANPKTTITTETVNDVTSCIERPMITDESCNVSMITALEYFKYAFVEIEKNRPKKLSVEKKVMSPVRSTLTRDDYKKMSASWDPATYKRRKKNECDRKIYTIMAIRDFCSFY